MPNDDDAYEEIALDLTATGGARSVLRLACEADYLALIDVSTDALEVSVNDGSYRRLRLGAVIRPRVPMRKIAIRNPSGGAITGTLAYGRGSYIDNRVIVASGGGTLPVSVQNASLVTVGLVADGAAIAGNPVLVGGTDGANARALLMDNGGRPQVNITQMNGVAPTMGNGVSGTGVQRVVLASDQTANANPFLVTAVPSSAQGAATSNHLITAAGTNATSVKGSAGTINGGCVSNANAAARFFKLYDKATAPVVGTDVPILTMLIPPGATVQLPVGSYGLRCSLGIAYALTTGIAVADVGAVGADLAVHLNYT